MLAGYAPMIVSLFLFFIIITILVLAHEFGHFIVAKRTGIRVDEFGLGFPPRLYGKKIGETLYSINALPFGGFVKIFGEDAMSELVSESERTRSFMYRPRVVQAAVIVAGVVMNVFVAFAMLSAGFMIGMPLPAENYPGASVSDAKLILTAISPNSPAAAAGLIPGDELISLESGEQKLSDATPDAVRQFISRIGAHPITVFYTEAGEAKKTVVTPASGIVPARVAIGIEMDIVGTVRLGPVRALIEGAKLTWGLTKLVAGAFFGLSMLAVRGHVDVASLSGPVGIISIIGSQAKLGFIYLVTLTAMISINLAVINLVPVPGLDGGRLLFIGIETLMRRSISPRIAAVVNTIGFALLIVLLVFITYHDVAKLL